MARIKIELPQDFIFSTIIPVRITDLNYGGHVGNDTILSMIHEARVQFLKSKNYSELNVEGAGLIMGDVAIEFKQELFYGEQVKIWVKASEVTKVAFSLYYKVQKQDTTGEMLVAVAKTGMVCYDYTRKKVMAVPEKAIEKLQTD